MSGCRGKPQLNLSSEPVHFLLGLVGESVCVWGGVMAESSHSLAQFSIELPLE